MPAKRVGDITVHFDNLGGVAKCSAVLIDGAFLPVSEVNLVSGVVPPGFIEFRISLAHVKLVVDPDPEEEDEFD